MGENEDRTSSNFNGYPMFINNPEKSIPIFSQPFLQQI